MLGFKIGRNAQMIGTDMFVYELAYQGGTLARYSSSQPSGARARVCESVPRRVCSPSERWGFPDRLQPVG